MAIEQILRIKITDIVNSPYQGRLFHIKDKLSPEDEEHIIELTKSIEQNGLMQPIIVRFNKAGKYELIDGHRRVIAYRRIGRGHIKAILKDLDDKQTQLFSIIANLQRKDLSPIEQAIAYQKILKSRLYADKRDLSKAIGKDETYVGDLLNMLKMDKRIIDDLLETKSINDVRLLRMIRNAAPINQNGFSPEQVTLYYITKEDKLNRKQLAKLIAARKKNLKIKNDLHEEEKNRINIKIKKRSVGVNISLVGIDENKKIRVNKLIQKALHDLNDTINSLE